LKAFFCTPHLTDVDRYGKFKNVGSFLPPLGICYLGAVLEKHGHLVRIIDGQLAENTHEHILQEIGSFIPDFIGISSVILSERQSYELADKIKLRFPDSFIIIGGPHVTTIMQDVMKNRAIDLAVYGEGEKTILDVMEYLTARKKLTDIPGIMWRKDDKVQINPPRPFIADLDEIPFPARHLLQNLERYSTHILAHRREPMTSMITSRGCPGKCVFCNRIFGQDYRFFSAKYVLGEIDQLMNLNGRHIREIEFEDDTFTVDQERIVQICNGLIERKYDLIWSCATRVNTISLELMKLMKKAGCWMIQIGVETGDEQVMKAIKKGISLARVKQVVDWANEAGMEVKGFFMLGHHVDTVETIEKTISFACSLKIHTANFAIVNPYPGTELFKLAREYGTFSYNTDNYSAHHGKPLFVPKGLTAQQLIDFKKRAYKSFYLHPYRIYKLLSEIRGWTDIKRLYKGLMAFRSL
jgi:radical SAM superfamily enzyme YgiQ (UPF0313 family)